MFYICWLYVSCFVLSCLEFYLVIIFVFTNVLEFFVVLFCFIPSIYLLIVLDLFLMFLIFFLSGVDGY